MQSDPDISLPTYPAVQFLIKWGFVIAPVLSVLPAIIALLAILAGGTWLWVLAAVLVAPVLYLFLRSYVELVRIIGDTLLPK